MDRITSLNLALQAMHFGNDEYDSFLPIKLYRTLVPRKTYPSNLMSLILPPFSNQNSHRLGFPYPSLEEEIESRRALAKHPIWMLPNHFFFTLRRSSFSAASHFTLASNRATSKVPRLTSPCPRYHSGTMWSILHRACSAAVLPVMVNIWVESTLFVEMDVGWWAKEIVPSRKLGRMWWSSSKASVIWSTERPFAVE